MPNPVINPVILLSPVETGYVAYDPAADRLHQLNPIAALLAELCDGSRSIADIRRLVAPLVPEGKAGEIDRWFDDATKVGLLVRQGSESAGHREFTADELYKLTARLYEYGNVQTAYICAKRVVELQPEHWDAWYDLGELCQCVGRRDEARTAYQKYFDVHPEDAKIEHLLAALRDEVPPRASDRTIQYIFKRFARSYDERMLQDLEYKGPERMVEALKAVIGDNDRLKVLDIGCGTGLAGVHLKRYASDLTGVDLSPEMIAVARTRNIYDRLEVAEIVSWLDLAKEQFDLIAGCDCLIYFGDLHEVTAAAARRLSPGGVFAFSMELDEHFPFHLSDTGRYTHHPDHVRDAAQAAHLSVAGLDQGFLRMEYGARVAGLYAILKKATGSVSS
jgi:predicted TPR repeat methyltransferase